ncbi:uncharacterized protein [Ptychodera flava]|uniref:uncharacterized protein n=1 Tax=Ptychodera flava TaxID=63121 RepID=UPI003969C036
MTNQGSKKSNTSTSKPNKAQQKPCLHCQDNNHSFDSCEQLIAASQEDTVNFLRNQGVCFGCLKPGHRSRQCKQKAKCSKCQGKHPTVLHQDRRPTTDKDEDSKRPVQTESVAVHCTTAEVDQVQSFMGTGGQDDDTGGDDDNCKVLLTIIPVKVKLKGSNRMVQTYAFLDTGSVISFCTEALQRKLGATGRKTKLTVNTVNGLGSHTCDKVTGIEVYNLDCSEPQVELKTVYTKPEIGVSEDYIPRQEDLMRWPHLKNIRLPRIDAEIGLMIGTGENSSIYPSGNNTWSGLNPSRMQNTRLERKLRNNPKFHADYQKFMADIIEKGYAIQVPNDELDRDDGKVWYIPHHGVYHPKKPEKIRVVFDCSAKFQVRRECEEGNQVDTRSDCSLQEGRFPSNKVGEQQPRSIGDYTKEERAKEIKDLKLEYDCLPVERALGTSWSVESDTIGFQINIESRPPTRRGILSIISSVYDPIGLAAPFILPARILLQDLCRRGIGWDAKIKEDDRKKWLRWLSDLPKLENVSTQRCYKPADFGEVKVREIHHFSDASEYGYGVASYIRLINEDGRIHCAFLMGKARVAPLKKITIPRLELTAATVAVRMNRMLEEELDIKNDKVYFWTDSTSVIKYCANETSRFHTFVANRINIIREGSDSKQWKYVDTKSNPADDASRGLTVDKFLQNKRWLRGPDFLWKRESEWPTQQDISRALCNKDPEVKRKHPCTAPY